MPQSFSIIATFFLPVFLLLVFCFDQPNDPERDPDNADVTLFAGDSHRVDFDSVTTIYLSTLYNRHFDSITISTTCNQFDTSFTLDTRMRSDTLAFNIRFADEGPCTVLVAATMREHFRSNKTAFLPLDILPENPKIAFIKFPATLISHAGAADTLKYVPKTSGGAAPPFDYAVTTQPLLDERGFTVFTSLDKDTFFVVLRQGLVFDGDLMVQASAPSSAGRVTASAQTQVHRYESFRPISSSLPPSISADTTTTLMFTADNSSRPDNLTLSLYAAGISLHTISGYAPSPDTLYLTIAPSDADSLHFGVVVSAAMLADTFFYHLPVLSSGTADRTPPVITRINGDEFDNRVTEPLGDITLHFSDLSGIDTAYWRLSGGIPQPLILTPDTMALLSYSLWYFGYNRIKVYAYDKISHDNIDSLEILLDYNTTPSQPMLTAPLDKTSNVSVTPTFSWSGGKDADGDTVYSCIRYGKKRDALNMISDTVKGNSVTINPKNRLGSKTTWYWIISSFTSGHFTDTATSPVYSFTTGTLPAAITTHPVNDTALEEQVAGFSVEALGDAPLTFEWQINGNHIPGATASICLIDSASLSFDKCIFTCIVSNSSGKDTSLPAVLHLIPLPIHTVSFIANGGSDVPAQEIKQGHFAKAPDPSPVKTGFRPGAWYSDSALTNAFDFSVDAITRYCQLFVEWIPAYSVIYVASDAENGTIPLDTGNYISGEKVTVAGNTGNLQKTGYQFDGWQSGDTAHKPGSTMIMGSAPCTLTVVWTATDTTEE